MKKKPGINKDHSTRVKTPDITALKKKSKIKKLTTENTKNEIPKIHEELINLYNSYSNDNKANEKSKNIIYNGSRGYFDRNETIIINNIPICVIYFDHKNITKIYVIKERKNYERESDIKSILKQLIKDLRDSNK